jgi:hypothetical protein
MTASKAGNGNGCSKIALEDARLGMFGPDRRTNSGEISTPYTLPGPVLQKYG